MLTVKLSTLRENPENNKLRYISTKKYEQLKKDLTRDGLLTPLLIWKDQRGEWVVIDGNHRYKAMVDLGWGQNEVRCDILTFGQEEEGFYAMIEGDPQRTRYFTNVEQGLLWYSLKRNDPGYAMYNKEATFDAMETMGIPMDEVNILVEEIPAFSEVINAAVNVDKVAEEIEQKEKKFKEIDITCPKCGEMFKKEV